MALILDGTNGLFGDVTGGDISGNFIGNFNDGEVTSTGSTTARQLADRFADVVNVKDFGAHSITEVGYETFDSTAAIQAAVNTGKTVYLPSGTYRTTSTINITGTGTGIYGDGPKATKILADISVTPVVKVDNGFHIKISDIWISRATGVVDPNSVGIQWDFWNYGYESCVTSDRHGYCWNYNGPTSSVAISHQSIQAHAYSSSNSYIRINNLADLYVSQMQCGKNGVEDYAPNNCVLITGDANAINFTDSIFIPRHPNSGTTTTTIYWENYTNTTGIFTFANCLTENILKCFKTNSGTARVSELRLIGGRWAIGNTSNFWDKNAATYLVNCSFTGVNFGGGTFLFEKSFGCRITGCWFEQFTINSTNYSLDESTLNVSGCHIQGVLTITGNWFDLQFVGNTHNGPYTNTATGKVNIITTDQLKFTTPTLSKVFEITGNKIAVGTSAPTSLFTIKNSTDFDDGGLALIGPNTLANPNNTNQWGIRTGSGVNSQLYFSYNNSSKAYIDYSTGAFFALSDAKLKENINPIQNGLENILKLNPVSYSMIFDSESKPHLGFIAQEVKEVLPISISEFSDGTLAMDKSEIIPVLVKAIQELSAKVEALESK